MRKTNTEFLTHLMEYSQHGALMQGFIMTAVEKYAEAVLARPDEIRSSPMTNMVNPEAWIGCAKELKDSLDKRLSGAPEPEIEARLLDEGED